MFLVLANGKAFQIASQFLINSNSAVIDSHGIVQGSRIEQSRYQAVKRASHFDSPFPKLVKCKNKGFV